MMEFIKNKKIDVRKYTMIISLIGIWILFSFLDKSGTFLSSRNLSNLFRQMATTAILAVGMLMILVDKHIDLSMGSLVGLTGGISAMLMYNFGMPWWASIIITLFVGAMLGAWTGNWVNKGVPAFIASLGGLLAYRGIILGISGGITVPVSDPIFRMIGTAYLPKLLGLILGIFSASYIVYTSLKKRNDRITYGFKVKAMYKEILILIVYVAIILAFVLTMNSYRGIPIPIVLVLSLGVIFKFITEKTQFGRQVYAIGGNYEAAKLSGINVKNRTLWIFIISGLLSAMAGILFTARLGSATPDAGNSFELDAVASCVIGGTSLLGGEGFVFGAILGALVMASIDNGMSIMNTESFWQYIVKGLILVVAVYIDISSKKKK
ncbi:sugar ABC transporter permease [Helicovermis profundi]|uniref:Xylose transport system permease protein XylH n=1 Tax=Helicovermis profundi TaxID=3065157 RepID=A0AAU9E892_9FIRM|nr:sugar ABC transporter permease [Clostridia bacterium S502]